MDTNYGQTMLPKTYNTYIGSTFSTDSEWHEAEVKLIENIDKQIHIKFPSTKNLLIFTTWFGPQFEGGSWYDFLELVKEEKFDKLFLLSADDSWFINKEQINKVYQLSGANELFLLGNVENQYQFTFIATLMPKFFKRYSDEEVTLQEPKYVYISYNRKPRQHRVTMVEKLKENNLLDKGIVTLGKNDDGHFVDHDMFLSLEEDERFADKTNWNFGKAHGVPHDIHSLGDLNLWQKHFLHIVSETEFNHWDPMFITEKTWKPIIGLRPFVINGQPQIYQYLRDNGFKTFEEYWPVEVAIEDEFIIHDRIIELIQWLTQQNLEKLYLHMLPDLLYNKNRFYEFAKEQSYKIENLL